MLNTLKIFNCSNCLTVFVTGMTASAPQGLALKANVSGATMTTFFLDRMMFPHLTALQVNYYNI
jgi:hypothetical protein